MDTEATLQVAETALNAVEGTLDTSVEIVRNNPYLLAGVGIAGIAVGAGATFLFLKKKLEYKYEQIAEQEIAEAKQFYAAVNKTEFETPGDAVQELIPDAGEPERSAEAVSALKSYQGDFDPLAPPDRDKLVRDLERPKVVQPEDHDVRVERVETVVTNVFVENKPIASGEWDQEAELENRRNGVPFVISREEWQAGELDFDKTTLTYYVEDDTLVDEREQTVDAVDRLVGEENLKRFGQGSGDNNVVFVRNEQSELDIEILKVRGSYAKTVLGFDDEDESAVIRHSADRRARRRGDDE